MNPCKFSGQVFVLKDGKLVPAQQAKGKVVRYIEEELQRFRQRMAAKQAGISSDSSAKVGQQYDVVNGQLVPVKFSAMV